MGADPWAALHDAVHGLDPVGTIALILIGTGVALRLSVVLIRRTLRSHAGWLMDEVWTIPNGRLEVFGNKGPQSGPHR